MVQLNIFLLLISGVISLSPTQGGDFSLIWALWHRLSRNRWQNKSACPSSQYLSSTCRPGSPKQKQPGNLPPAKAPEYPPQGRGGRAETQVARHRRDRAAGRRAGYCRTVDKGTRSMQQRNLYPRPGTWHRRSPAERRSPHRPGAYPRRRRPAGRLPQSPRF